MLPIFYGFFAKTYVLKNFMNMQMSLFAYCNIRLKGNVYAFI